MPTLQGCNIKKVVTSFAKEFEHAVEEALGGELNPGAVLDLEESVYQTSRSLGDAIIASLVRYLLESTALDRMAVHAFKACQPDSYRDEGKRCVKVHFAGGGVYAFMVTYLRPYRAHRKGRKKKRGKRGKSGKGVFPALDLLGIHVVHSKLKVTPLLEDRLIYALTAGDSHEAGRKLLEKWGIKLGAEPLQNFFERAGEDFRAQRAQWLEHHPEDGPVDPKDFEGKRVVISTDGGRGRLRYNKPGRPRKSGYHGFDAEWKEPKLFCIYVIDEEGKRCRSVRSVIDGVMVDDDEVVGANVLFDTLEAYLAALRIDRAAQVVFVADGAPWIWRRARNMLERLGVESDKIFEVIDWFHAKQTLCELSEMPQSWSKTKRIGWRNKAIDALKKGDVDQVLDLIDTLKKASGAADAHDRRDYFARNRARMQYRDFKRERIPRGSGAVESAVRRVINQRIKSNAKFWCRKNVETMLMWRGYLKCDRLDDLTRWTRRFRAGWWTQSNQHRAQAMLKAA